MLFLIGAEQVCKKRNDFNEFYPFLMVDGVNLSLGKSFRQIKLVIQ